MKNILKLFMVNLKQVFAEGYSYLIQNMWTHLQTEIIFWVSLTSVHGTGEALK